MGHQNNALCGLLGLENLLDIEKVACIYFHAKERKIRIGAFGFTSQNTQNSKNF